MGNLDATAWFAQRANGIIILSVVDRHNKENNSEEGFVPRTLGDTVSRTTGHMSLPCLNN
jgi:hypothetical protein